MNTENIPMGNPQMPPQQPPYQQPPQPGQPPQYQPPQYGQPQYGQPQYGQPQYGQPQYQPPYQAPVQTRPNMGLYIAACVAHLIFCLFMFLSAFEIIKSVNHTLSGVMLMLGAVSSLFIFVGFKVYCKSRLISAPCTLLVIAQFIYTVIFLIILIDPKFVVNKNPALICGLALLLAFLIMLIGRLIVGGKLMGKGQPGVGLMVIAVAVSQILMIVLGIINAKELQSNSYDAVVAMQRLGAVTWFYYIATTLESLLAIFMFANKDK